MAWLPWKPCMPARKAAQVAPESSQVGSITSTPEEGNTSKTGHLDKLTEMEIFDLETAFRMFDVDGNGARIEHTKSLTQSPTQTLYPDEQVSWSVSRVTSEVCICVYRPLAILASPRRDHRKGAQGGLRNFWWRRS